MSGESCSVSENVSFDKKEFRKKCIFLSISDSPTLIYYIVIVYPLMEFLNREKALVSKVAETKRQRTFFVYGFTAETKKKQIVDKMRSLGALNQLETCNVISLHRPTAIFTFKTKESCMDNYEAAMKGLESEDSIESEGDGWTVCNVRNFCRKIPPKSKLERSKVIVRNLHFKTSVEGVFKKFKSCGPIVSIRLPTRIRDSGNLVRVGCCFVQYCAPTDARRAVRLLNESQIMGRTIVVDIAVKKELYEAQKPTVPFDVNESQDESKAEGENSSETPEEMCDEQDILNWKIDTEADPPKIIKKDDSDQLARTVFIQNISWITTEESLRESLEKRFGELEFCALVLDPVFKRPKGSGFARFVNVSDCEKCLGIASGPTFDEVALDGMTLKFLPALKKEDVIAKEEQRKKQSNSVGKRNLHLVDAGLVYDNAYTSESSSEAILKGALLSENDKKNRARMLKEKRSKLKNTNFFVSSTRLCIRNIPLYVDEGQLSRTFTILGGKDCRLKKARLMRSKMPQRTFSQADGSKMKPKSMGYAFVEFSNHQHAMTALKASANHLASSVFQCDDKKVPDHRQTLIVEFSVENAQAINQQKLKKRQVRILQSKRDATLIKGRFFDSNNIKPHHKTNKPQKTQYSRKRKVQSPQPKNISIIN